MLFINGLAGSTYLHVSSSVSGEEEQSCESARLDGDELWVRRLVPWEVMLLIFFVVFIF